eukprot:2785279-Pyramimonas_sp.AAC.1
MKLPASNFHCEESNWSGWAWARISGQRVRSGSLAAKIACQWSRRASAEAAGEGQTCPALSRIPES